MTTTTATQTSLSTSTTPIVTRSRLAAAAYWTTTALAALAFLSGGAIDIGQPANMVALMAHLGYPAFLLTLLGVWKILGGVAILAPRLPRLKEWAYAGMFFDLTGAAVSHAATGDAAGDPGPGAGVVGAASGRAQAGGRAGGGRLLLLLALVRAGQLGLAQGVRVGGVGSHAVLLSSITRWLGRGAQDRFQLAAVQ